MRRTMMVAAAAVLAGVGAAAAADLGSYRGSAKDEPLAYAPITWSGFYIGAHAGGAWGESRHTDSDGVTSGDFDIDGFVGGATLGYNHQTGRLVLGVEADVSGGDIEGSVGGVCEITCASSIDVLWTIRGRLGYDMGRWMPYVTAGLAVADAEASLGDISGSETLTGFAVGGGAEVKLGGNWSLKAEYLFTSLDEFEYADGLEADFDELHVARVGVNYKFGSRDEPLK